MSELSFEERRKLHAIEVRCKNEILYEEMLNSIFDYVDVVNEVSRIKYKLNTFKQFMIFYHRELSKQSRYGFNDIELYITNKRLFEDEIKDFLLFVELYYLTNIE